MTEADLEEAGRPLAFSSLAVVMVTIQRLISDGAITKEAWREAAEKATGAEATGVRQLADVLGFVQAQLDADLSEMLIPVGKNSAVVAFHATPDDANSPENEGIKAETESLLAQIGGSLEHATQGAMDMTITVMGSSETAAGHMAIHMAQEAARHIESGPGFEAAMKSYAECSGASGLAAVRRNESGTSDAVTSGTPNPGALN